MKETLPFGEGWLFHLGDIPVAAATEKSPLYTEAKTERKRCGPAAKDYMDSREYYGESGLITHETWRPVTLPHDYIIGQAPRAEENGALGFFHYDNGWYRKRFHLEESDAERRIVLYFEGVATHCTVYVNGCYMLTNRCGYTSFEVDMTDVAVFGGSNTVAVYVDTREHEGWWYEGAGIYRPVWLIKAEYVSVEMYGVFVHPEKQADDAWTLPVDITLRNDGYEAAVACVRSVVYDPQGQTVARMEAEADIPPRGKITLRQTGEAHNPRLWDVDSPCLYTLETTVTVAGTVVERQRNRFGFRTIRFDADGGFFLNGRRVEIKGVCCHQDYGLTGKAVPPRVQRYRLALLKEMGANGYRCAHYPHHACTMDALDEMGFLVMAETRWFESTPEGMAQLEMLIRRDRNHPSVVLWSIGNEEPLHRTPAGRRIAQAMRHRVHALDGTRPVTTAVSHDPAGAAVADAVDVMGVNYNLTHLDRLHARHPRMPLLSSECAAASTTRGWYWADCPARGYVSAYDRDTNKTFLAREKTWQYLMARPWIAGGFQWAGFEHRGEAVWPRLCSQAGALDLFLHRKDAFYQNQSHWREEPMAHLLPHWNWPGMEGEAIRVCCYTNCDRVELRLNGALVGDQAVVPGGHAEWQVPYAPGRLEARGYRRGALACTDAVETTGAPIRLRLRLETGGLRADGEDVAILTCDCLDDQGRHVPDAAPYVRFLTNDKGQVRATGSDVSDHVPVTCPDRQMRAGLISVLVQAGGEPGRLVVRAEAEGLTAAVLGITLSK